MNLHSIIIQHCPVRLRVFLMLTLFSGALYASPTVTTAPPAWSVNPGNYEFNFNMVVRVRYSGTPSNGAGNIVGAFIGNELRGVSTPVISGGNAYYFLTVYSNTYVGEDVHFEFYYAPNDHIYGAPEHVIFRHNLDVGSTGSPFWLNIDPNTDYPPELLSIPPDTTLVGIPFPAVNLNNYLVSLDGDPVTWTVQPGPHLTVTLVNGVLTVVPIPANWTGTDTVRVIVTENTPNHKADTTTARFTVLPDYGPPIWQNIPGQTIFQGQTFTSFDLDNYLTFNGPCHKFDYNVFPFTGTVTAPVWTPPAPGTQPMTIVARPLFANQQLAGTGAKLAAFVNGILAGVASPSGAAPNIIYNLVLKNVGSGPITFRFYHASNQYLYEKVSTLNFAPGGFAGTAVSPYLIQYSPLVPSLAPDGTVQITVNDPAWLGNYPINFIVWDCNFPTLRRDTQQAIFSIITDIRPKIISPATVSFQENACNILYDTQTSDPNNSEGAGLTYTLAGGADAARFAINAQNGILSWTTGFSPDFENPADADMNNQYIVKIRVTNAANLSDTLTLTVTITDQPTEPFTASINGGVSLICITSTANLQAAGGVSYLWNTGSTLSSIPNAGAGAYTVTVTSTGSCTATASVLVAPKPGLTASGNSSPVCIGSNIVLHATPSGGTLPYATFAWSGPNGYTSGLQNPTGFAATPAAAGVYNVTLTDAAGCTATASVTILVSGNTAPTVTATVNTPICEGANVMLAATPSGGSGSGYTYLWAGPNNYAGTTATPPVFPGVIASSGLYMVTVTDNAGCAGTGTTTLQVYAKPTASATSNSPVSVDATVLLTSAASGGSGSGYAFAWMGPNGFSASQANPPGFSASLAAAGVYNVTVTDGHSCSNTASTTLVVVPCPTISASANTPICTGGTILLQSVPNGGATPYNGFAWSGPNNYGSTAQNPVGFPAAAGTGGVYTVTVTDHLGCTATATTTVAINTPPSITAAGNGPLCQGSNIVLTSTPSGGSGTFSAFLWTGPDNFSSILQNPLPFTGAPASSGIYQVKVTDSHGCTATGTATITVNPQPGLTASSNSPVCLGAFINLTSSPTGGSGTYVSYNWTGPNGFTSMAQNPAPLAAALNRAGTYLVTVTDNAGCSVTASTTVVVSNNTAPSITAGSNSPVCSGNSLILTSSPSGGSGVYTAYGWAGPNSFTSTQQNPTPFQVFVNAAGVYTVTVTDSHNCQGTTSLTVTVNGPTSNPSSNSPVCPGGMIQLTGAPSGQGFTYAWTGPNTYSLNQQNPPGFQAISGTNGTYTLIVHDAQGCSAIGTTLVSIGDNQPPSITCPGPQTVSTGPNCNGVVGSYAPVALSDNCSSNVTFTQSPAATTPLNGNNDFKTVTLTANDGNGNTSSCNFVVTLKDQTAPAITCPGPQTVNANAACTGFVGSYSPVTLSDNCSNSISVTQSPVSTTILNGNNDAKTVTLTADDGNGNTQICSFTVTLKDVTPPSITCPGPQTVNANANCAGVVGSYAPTAISDNCTAIPTFTQSPAATTSLNGNNDTKTITLTANDGNGNTNSCSFVVTLKDVTPPTVVCPGPQTVNANANCAGVVGSYSPTSLTDNCATNSTFTQSPAATTPLNGNNDTKTVTFTASDGNGNTSTCSFTVTLKDVTPPSITCPPNATINADNNCSGAIGSYAAVSASDNCTANPVVTQSPVATTLLHGQNDSKTVTLTADDGNGNTKSCSFTVTLKDVTPPSITCPGPQTVNANANCAGVVGSYSPTAVSDNCTANPAVTQSPAPTTPLNGNNDTKTVTLTANDGNGNSSSCSFTVTLKDVTPPLITCPGAQTVNANANCSGVVGAYSPVTLSDNCAANPTFTQSPVATTPLNGNNDTKTVTLTANDGNGNTSSCSFTVTLKDVTPPVIVCPGPQTVNANANCTGVIGSWTPVSASDNCTANPAVTQSPAPATTLSGHNDFKTVTLTANDGNGNTSSCSFTVTLKDVTPPTVVCKPFTAILNAAGSVAIIPAHVFQSGADNCGTVNLVSVVPNSFTCANLGNNTVVLTVNDGHGNTATCTAVVTVIDNLPPTMLCKPATLALNAAGQATLTVAQINNGSSDNCTLTSLSLSQALFTCANLGANTVILTGKDQSGNTATCSATVTVVDNIPPTMLCKNATIALNAAGQATLTVAQINNGSFDNCTLVTLTLSQTAFTCANLGNNNVTLTGTDQSGNSATCTAVVTVVDLIAPVAKCKNITANLDLNGKVIIPAASINNGSTDNCSFTLSLTPFNFTCANVGVNTVTLTVTDASGNFSKCTAQVTVQDVTPPNVVCLNPAVYLSKAGKATLSVAQVESTASSDNCGIVTATISTTQFNCSDIGSPQTVYLTVTDAAGNSSTCQSHVTVKDTMAPKAICQNTTVHLGPNGTVSVLTAPLASGSFDNCAVWSFTPVVKVYNSANLGNNNLVITVKDYSGNASNCTSVVTVLPPGPVWLQNAVNTRDCVSEDSPVDSAGFEVLLYPNPTTGQITMTFQLETEQEIALSIFSSEGRLVGDKNWMGAKGENTTALDLQSLGNGIYWINLHTGGINAQKRVVVLKN
jgi:hypothetical protein